MQSAFTIPEYQVETRQIFEAGISSVSARAWNVSKTLKWTERWNLHGTATFAKYCVLFNSNKKTTFSEKIAWQFFLRVVEGFLGNPKKKNYEKLVDSLLHNLGKINCHTSMSALFAIEYECIHESKSSAFIVTWSNGIMGSGKCLCSAITHWVS